MTNLYSAAELSEAGSTDRCDTCGNARLSAPCLAACHGWTSFKSSYQIADEARAAKRAARKASR